VFHLAADAAVGGGKDAYLRNVAGTAAVIAAAGACPALRRLVFTSTIGAVDRRPDDACTAPLDEDTAPHPLTWYGRSKLESEGGIASSGLPYTIVRPAWVYGPGMRAGGHIALFTRMVQRGSLATRFDFPGRVSVICVSDLVDALLEVACRPEAEGRIFFASDGRPVALGTLFRRIGELTGQVGAGTRGVPRPLAAGARRVRRWMPLAAQNLHSDVLRATNTRLEALGFVAKVDLDTGLARTIRALAADRSGEGVCLVTGAASGIGRALASSSSTRTRGRCRRWRRASAFRRSSSIWPKRSDSTSSRPTSRSAEWVSAGSRTAPASACGAGSGMFRSRSIAGSST